MPDGQGSARLVGRRAYILVTVPVASLRGADDDRSGLLSDREVRAHLGELTSQLERLVRFDNGDVRGRTLYHEVLVPHLDSAAGVEVAGLTVMRIDEWESTVTRLAIHADVFSVRSPPHSRQLVFRAILGDSVEVAVLSRDKTSHGFFGAQAGGGGIRALVMLAGLAVILGLSAVHYVRCRVTPTSVPEGVAPQQSSLTGMK